MARHDLLKSVEVTRIRDAKLGADARATAEKIAAANGQKTTGTLRLADGRGLYLVVDPSGAARWLFLFRFGGKLKEMGCGSLSKVSLTAARDKAESARDQIGEGVNPIQAKRAARAIPTFGEVADELLKDIAPGYRNPKHLTAWQRMIGAPRTIRPQRGKRGKPPARTSYAEPLRAIRVDQVTADDVFQIIRPLWLEKQQSAQFLRSCIERVLAAAKAAGYRSGENPARWKEGLKERLARPSALVQHRPALAYDQMPAFMRELRAQETMSARTLDFAILCASRLGEVRGATWAEIDLGAKLWTIPAARMKAGAEHRVPLSDDAVTLLEQMQLIWSGDPAALVFPSARGPKTPQSERTLMALLRRMGHETITVHGMRSSFRDWAGDETSFPASVAEHALAHAVGSAVERAYRRKDALERRRELMAAWGRYIGGGAEIIDLDQRQRA